MSYTTIIRYPSFEVYGRFTTSFAFYGGLAHGRLSTFALPLCLYRALTYGCPPVEEWYGQLQLTASIEGVGAARTTLLQADMRKYK
jgi:hypothetical protein